MHHRTYSSCRGTAMLELMLGLTPYTLIMIGCLYLWNVMAGQQEVIKYTTSAATNANVSSSKFAQSLGGTFNAGSITTYDASSESGYDAVAEVTEEDVEPVWPLDTDGNDLSAAISRETLKVKLNWDGTVNVSTTITGRQLRREGLIENVKTGTDLSIDDNFDFDINMDVMQDISYAMREWMSATEVAGASFTTKPAGGALPFEEPDPDSWRNKTTTVGGGNSSRQFGFIGVDPQMRGTYSSGPFGVRLEDMPADLAARGEATEAVAPLEMASPYLSGDGGGLYDKDYGAW